MAILKDIIESKKDIIESKKDIIESKSDFGKDFGQAIRFGQGGGYGRQWGGGAGKPALSLGGGMK